MLPEQPLCPVMLIDLVRKKGVQEMCNPQGSGGGHERTIWHSEGKAPLGHMIREFSPKAVFLPPFIHITLTLATLPRLHIQGDGGKTLCKALKSLTR